MKLAIRTRIVLTVGLGLVVLVIFEAHALASSSPNGRIWLSLVAVVTFVGLVLAGRAFVGEAAARDQASRDLRANSLLLREAYDELRDLYQNAPIGYHSVDDDGIVVRMNDTELRWLGYAREEVVGRLHIGDLVMPSGREDALRRIETFKRTGQIHDRFVEYRRRDGTALPALMSATAVRDAEGRFVMTRTVITDITEQRRIQHELERTVAELEHAIASVRTLSGLLPMCSLCHKIRDDQGYWARIEQYVTTHTDAQVSHGVCPDCFPKLFPGLEMKEEPVSG